MESGLLRKQKWKFADAFLAIFIAIFTSIFLQIFFFNSAFGYSPFIQGGLLVVWLFFLGAAAFFAIKHKKVLFDNKYKILAGVLLFVFLIQLWVGFATTQKVNHDYGKVFNGAVMFATEGDIESFYIYKNYYHHFTNNVGEFLLLQLIFKAMVGMGLTCFYEVAVILGHLLFTAAILCTFLYLDKTFGAAAAIVSLVFYLCFLPVYFQSSIAYTDTYTIWIPPLILYLNMRARKTKSWVKRLTLYALLGVLFALAMELKGTVLITGVAIFIEMLLSGKFKKLLAAALVVAITFTGARALIKFYTYSVILEEDRVQQESMPVTYWLMMGLAGDGSYNPTDEWVITSSVAGLDARTQLNILVIKERLHAMGPVGYLQLLHRKTNRTFGSGNAEIYYLLVREPANPQHWVYQFVSAEGRYFRYFDNVTQCVYLSFYIFALVGCGIALQKRTQSYLENTAPFLALVGFYFFMMLWESNHRLLVNQWPLYLIVASAGLVQIVHVFQNHRKSKKMLT